MVSVLFADIIGRTRIYGHSATTAIVANIASIHASTIELDELIARGVFQRNRIKKYSQIINSISKNNSFFSPNTPPILDNDLSSMLSHDGKSLQSTLTLALRNYSTSHYIALLKEVITIDKQLLHKKIAHFNALVRDLSSQWLSRCPTTEDFTFTISGIFIFSFNDSRSFFCFR